MFTALVIIESCFGLLQGQGENCIKASQPTSSFLPNFKEPNGGLLCFLRFIFSRVDQFAKGRDLYGFEETQSSNLQT